MTRHRVWSSHQSAVLQSLYEADGENVAASIDKTINDAKNPRLSRDYMLDVIATSKGFSCPAVAHQLKEHWQMSEFSIPKGN